MKWTTERILNLAAPIEAAPRRVRDLIVNRLIIKAKREDEEKAAKQGATKVEV